MWSGCSLTLLPVQDLKRFSEARRTSKLSTFVNFPMKDLDLREFASENSSEYHFRCPILYHCNYYRFNNRVETVLKKYRSVLCSQVKSLTELKAMERAACLLTSVRVCASVRSKRSVQPVRRVEPLGHHHGRSLHSLLSQPQLGRVVHVQ